MTSILDFGDAGSVQADAVPAVRAAIAHVAGQAKSGSATITFPQATYHFWPHLAEERYLFISNNDESLARIGFPLFDCKDLTIDGQGSRFVFHGYMIPFALRGCESVRLSGFTVDWERTFHSEAEVVATGEGFVDLKIDAQRYPHHIERGRLVFVNELGKKLDLGAPLEFDPVKRETAYKVYDNYGVVDRHSAEAQGDGVVRFRAEFSSVPTVGNMLVMPIHSRLCPGITIGDSSAVEIDQITLHHCGGMGIVAQNTRDIRVSKARVTPGEGRISSLTADATHFVNCSGHIEIVDCLLESQMDDPVNVHGIYVRVRSRVSDTEIEAELVHPQQLGIDIAEPGDTVEIVRGKDLAPYGNAKIAGVERLNKEVSRYRFSSPVSAAIKPGDAMQNLDRQPDLTIRNCTCRCNRARGPLISTGGKVVVEDNHFHTAGAAILIAGDANYWFESGPVRDVVIRRNTFDNCNYGVWGRATIEISPEVTPGSESRYHRNIRIEDNRFKTFHNSLVKAISVDGLSIAGNRIESSTDYSAFECAAGPFDLADCSNVVVGENDGLPATAS